MAGIKALKRKIFKQRNCLQGVTGYNTKTTALEIASIITEKGLYCWGLGTSEEAQRRPVGVKAPIFRSGKENK